MFKPYFEGKKGIIFDLDGTIANTYDMWADVLNTILENLGIGWIYVPDHFRPGSSVSSFWDHILNMEDIDIKIPIGDLTKQTYDKFIESIKHKNIDVIEEFWPFFAEIKEDKKLKVGLATNTPKYVAEEILKNIGINSTFDVKVFGDDVKKVKPHPDIYKLAVEKMGLKNSEILVFEDSVDGTKSAVSAKLDTIVILRDLGTRRFYPRGVMDFVPDFSPFVGNLDRDPKDYFFDYINQAAKDINKP